MFSNGIPKHGYCTVKDIAKGNTVIIENEDLYKYDDSEVAAIFLSARLKSKKNRLTGTAL